MQHVWKARARAARLQQKHLAVLTGYAVPSISRALKMPRPPLLLRLMIVLAETMSPEELEDVLKRC